MGGAVVADEARPVEANTTGRFCRRDVHDELVEGALQERRVDGDHGPVRRAASPPRTRPRAARRCRRRRSARGTASRSGPGRCPDGIAAVMRDDALVARRFGDERVARTPRVNSCGRARRRWACRSRSDERPDAVERVRLAPRPARSLALARHRVDDHRGRRRPWRRRLPHRARCRDRRWRRRTSNPSSSKSIPGTRSGFERLLDGLAARRPPRGRCRDRAPVPARRSSRSRV